MTEEVFAQSLLFTVLFYPFAVITCMVFVCWRVGFKESFLALRGRLPSLQTSKTVLKSFRITCSGVAVVLGVCAWQNYHNLRTWFIVTCVLVYGLAYWAASRVVKIDSRLKGT